MKTPECFFKIHFIDEDKNDRKYVIEENAVNSDWEIIPLLAQGYVRCINVMGLNGNDRESPEELHGVIRRMLLVGYEYLDFIEKQYDTKSIIDLLKYLEHKHEKYTTVPLLNMGFSDLPTTPYFEGLNSDVSVKYEVKVGNNGQLIFYYVTYRMDAFTQHWSYLIMLKTLLPRLHDFKSFFFFIAYMIEIDKQIGKNDYCEFTGMFNIIKNASNTARKLIDTTFKDDADFRNFILCLPHLKKISDWRV